MRYLVCLLVLFAVAACASDEEFRKDQGERPTTYPTVPGGIR